MDYTLLYVVVFTFVLVWLCFRPLAIRVRALRLVDLYGKVRASLDTSADGKPGLWLYDNLGRPVAVFGLLAQGIPDLSSLAPDDVKKTLMIGNEGTPGLMLLDASGRVRVVVDLDKDGTPGLSLRDAKGEELFSAP